MPLFSEHIANMYYGSSSPYTGYHSYSSSVSPIGSSYSSSYLNPGSSYSNHSSLSSYSRAPLSSRWITSTGRNYSPMLSTITERGSGSPVRIHSPRRIPIASRTYGTPTYTPRPVNINTADIDVSRDRYRHKVEPSTPPKPAPPQPRKSSNAESENSPFMPRVDGKPETGVDSSPGGQRSTIKRGRTVVRLYTIKRNSPRKPAEESEASQEQEAVQNVEDTKTDDKEFMKWREKLSDDLAYKDKKEKKTMGAKLVEKFKVKDVNDEDSVPPTKIESKETETSQSLPTTPAPNINLTENKILDRRCSMELLAEQANLLDSLIRSENLSTASLDLSKIGVVAEPKNNIETFDSIKRRKPDNNPLKTTKSDHSLHDSLKSCKDVSDLRNFSKRRSIRKSSSGSSILRRLDSITEFPKELINVDLPAIEEHRLPEIQDNTKQTSKPKLKTKITSSVEVSAPLSPLKFRIENVTVEEKPRILRKEITYSSEVEIPTNSSQLLEKVADKSEDVKKVQKKVNKKNIDNNLASPEPEDGNFWDKIGKRETVYLMKRKQNLDEANQKNKRSLFWFPEEKEVENDEELKPNNISNSEITLDNSMCLIDTNKHKTMDVEVQKVSIEPRNKNEDSITDHKDKLALLLQNEFPEEQKAEELELSSEILKDSTISNENGCMKENVTKIIPNTELISELSKEVKDSSGLFKENEVDTETTSCKVTTIAQDCKNIGKSASLDAIDEIKVKTSSQKKTKSEKTKKILKLNDKVELKSLQSLLPKPNKKTEILEKLQSTNNIQVEQNEAALENVPKDIICVPVLELTEKEVEKPVLLESNTLEINTAMEDPHIDYLEKRLEGNRLIKSIEDVEETDDKVLKLNANTFLQSPELLSSSITNHTSLKTTEQKETTYLRESKPIDKIDKNDEIPKKSTPNSTNSKSIKNRSESAKDNKTGDTVLDTSKVLSESIAQSTSKVTNTSSNNVVQKLNNSKVPNSNKNITTSPKSSAVAQSKPSTPAKLANVVNKSDKTDDKLLKATIVPVKSEEPTNSSNKTCNICTNKAANVPSDGSVATLHQTADLNISPTDPSLHEITKTFDVPDIPIVIESQDIPNKEIESITEFRVQTEKKTGEENKAENIIKKDEQPETSKEGAVNPPEIVSAKRPMKEEKAVRPLIATPRPLQKKPPQVIHSSDSSDSSSEEESSDEDDEDESDASEDSAEFLECENNPDGRISTGSNDSGFDSSAPTSPATFSQIRKDCDVNCHRKCEKLTANLCGVNQRLLVEALASRTASRKGGEPGASSSATPALCNNTDIVEQELEQSTAYDIFRKTGRFTPPARSIPRFRKYMVEDFQFIKVLGKGSFGKVLLAELRDTEYYYAVKCLKKDVVLEDDDVECTLIERKVLALGTNHPYLCHLFATFQTDSHLFFVMEYLNGGDLMFHIQQSGRFPEARARFYAAEIVSGLKFLHKRGIVYRDLKLDNILLDFEGHVRIADFGMCKLQIYLDKTADTFCGTPDYMAPEIIKGLKYNQTVDWWSFGVLLYEMLIGQSPFSGCDEDELFWSICNEMPSYPRFLSNESLTILTRLLDKDARTRLGGTECMHGDIRDQDFFHAIHWDRLERRDLETPFRPRVRHPMDTQYFDKAFTGERPRLTAVEPHVLRSMDQEPFRGFSYTNPNTTDR